MTEIKSQDWLDVRNYDSRYLPEKFSDNYRLFDAILADQSLSDREKLRHIMRIEREHLHKEHTQLYYAILAVLDE